MKESDLFYPVKDFLYSIGCDAVYGEVSLFDVLGLSGVCNIGVELKKQLNFKLLDQAIDRLDYVEYLYLAVPKRKTPYPRSVMLLLKQYNIGLLEIEEGYCNVIIPANFNRKSKRLRQKLGHNIRDRIKEHHKNEIGGVKSGEGNTPYSIMIKNIKTFLKYHKRGEGATIEEILEHCETHYRNPKPSLIATLKAEWNQEWCNIYIENKERYFKLKEK